MTPLNTISLVCHLSVRQSGTLRQCFFLGGGGGARTWRLGKRAPREGKYKCKFPSGESSFNVWCCEKCFGVNLFSSTFDKSAVFFKARFLQFLLSRLSSFPWLLGVRVQAMAWTLTLLRLFPVRNKTLLPSTVAQWLVRSWQHNSNKERWPAFCQVSCRQPLLRRGIKWKFMPLAQQQEQTATIDALCRQLAEEENKRQKEERRSNALQDALRAKRKVLDAKRKRVEHLQRLASNDSQPWGLKTSRDPSRPNDGVGLAQKTGAKYHVARKTEN